MKATLILFLGLILLSCLAGAALAAGAAPAAAPAPHAAAPAAAPPAGGAHGAAPLSGGGVHAGAAPMGARGVATSGAVSGRSARGTANTKSASGGRSATGTGTTPKSAFLNAYARPDEWWICADGSGTTYQSYTPCGPGQGTVDYENGSGATYNLFFFFVPAAAERQASASAKAPGGLGGFAEATAGSRGGSTKSAGGIAPGTGLRLVDPWAAGMPMTAQSQGLPVMTRLSEAPVDYAIVLRSGVALATQEQPTRSGNTVIGHDRSGHLFSVRASEVDLPASRLDSPPAPPK
jgi:hypothetical protein